MGSVFLFLSQFQIRSGIWLELATLSGLLVMPVFFYVGGSSQGQKVYIKAEPKLKYRRVNEREKKRREKVLTTLGGM